MYVATLFLDELNFSLDNLYKQLLTEFIALFGLYPFLILQARQIGLSYGDISIVLGIIPIAAGLCNPPIGKNYA